MVSMTKTDINVISKVIDWSILLNNTEDQNTNLKPAQKELLMSHNKLCHADMQRIQSLTVKRKEEKQILLTKNPKVSSCIRPLCATCQIANQGRRSPEMNKTTPLRSDVLRSNDLEPGKLTSTDQYISLVQGRLPHTKGKEKKSKKYTGGTLFYDHASKLIQIIHQVSLRDGETLQSKHEYERFAHQHGVKVKGYHADNKSFGNNAFINDIKDKGQVITFSGVGAHHQNAVAERAIKTVTYWARAMMLHAVIHWPTEADLELWPFAMKHAVYMWNRMPSKESRLAPLEIFSRSHFQKYSHLNRAHVWGCPTCVLDPKLQDGKKVPKWKPRARRGKFLGFSANHSSRVRNIRNLTTGAIANTTIRN